MFRLPLSLGLLFLAATAFAQNPVPPRGLPAENPALPAPGGLPPLPVTVKLQYPTGELSVILDEYERLTRKKLIRPSILQTSAPIYIVFNEDLPREDAVKIIEMTLLINGYTLIPSEDPSIVKVFGSGANPRTGGIAIISDPGQIPEKEQVISFLFHLKYADPTELAQVLNGFISPSQAGYSSILPLPKAQALLVTENTPIIRGLLKIVNEIDLPPATVDSFFIALERADVKDVLEKLEKIFEKNPTPGAAGAVPGVPRPVRPLTTPEGLPIPNNATAEVTSPNTVEINGSATLTEDSLIVGKIRLIADVRTNRIQVITRKENIKFVRMLIEEFDRDVPFGEPSEYPLKFVTASDVLDPVIQAIKDPGAKDDGAGAAGGQGAAGTRQGTNTNRGGANANTGGANGSSFGGGSSGNSAGGFSEELQTSEVNTQPRAVTVGNTRIIADTRSNKIIVLGNKEVKNKIFKLLARLDQRAPQVMIHAVIGQLELTNNESFGVDYILHKGGSFAPSSSITGGTTTTPGTGTTATTSAGNIVTFGSTGAPTLNFNSLINQRMITQIAAAGTGGLSGFIAAGNSLDVVVNALQATNRFHVVARPNVFTSNNKKAIIASGQEIAVPTQSLSSLNNSTGINQDNASVSTSVQFKRVALQLEVVPLINSEREVTLEILQKIDELVPGGDRRVGGNDIPTIANRFLKSTVSVPNESTLVLGGLIRTQETKGATGIPYLSKIPLFGALFRSTTTSKTRSELVILIRPVVSMGPEETVQTREREQEYMNIEPDLESTIIPQGIRRRAPSQPAFREPPAVSLREKTLAPSFRK